MPGAVWSLPAGTGSLGYSADFHETCQGGLSLHLMVLRLMPAVLPEAGGDPVGVARISIEDRQAALEKPFVHSRVMGRGIGWRLFDRAALCAGQAGADKMIFAADPGPVPF